MSGLVGLIFAKFYLLCLVNRLESFYHLRQVLFFLFALLRPSSFFAAALSPALSDFALSVRRLYPERDLFLVGDWSGSEDLLQELVKSLQT